MLVSPTYPKIPSSHDSSFPSKDASKSSKNFESCMNVCTLSTSSSSSAASSFNALSPSETKQLTSSRYENVLFTGDNESPLLSDSILSAEKGRSLKISGPNDEQNNVLSDQVETIRKTSNESNATNPSSDGCSELYEHVPLHLQNSQTLTQLNTLPPPDLPSVPLQSSRQTSARKTYENITDKEMRKKLKNRESAQAARDRKKAKMFNLERQNKELMQRNQMLEADNAELRTQLHKVVFENGLWSSEKQKPVNPSIESSAAVIPYQNVPSSLESQSDYNPAETIPLNPISEYSTLSRYSEYDQPLLPSIADLEPSTSNVEANLSAFNQLTVDPNNFSSSCYTQELWSDDMLTSLPPTQHPLTYPAHSRYSNDGSML